MSNWEWVALDEAAQVEADQLERVDAVARMSVAGVAFSMAEIRAARWGWAGACRSGADAALAVVSVATAIQGVAPCARRQGRHVPRPARRPRRRGSSRRAHGAAQSTEAVPLPLGGALGPGPATAWRRPCASARSSF
jgi:hypothetical protein